MSERSANGAGSLGANYNLNGHLNKICTIKSESRSESRKQSQEILDLSNEHSQEILDLSNDFKIRSTQLINQKLVSNELSKDMSREREKININNKNNKYDTCNINNCNKKKLNSSLYNKTVKNIERNKVHTYKLKLDEKTIQKLDENTRTNNKINIKK